MRPTWTTCGLLAVGLWACARAPADTPKSGSVSPSPAAGGERDPAAKERTSGEVRSEAVGLAWTPGPSLPAARSNNVVAFLPGLSSPALFTLLGLGAGRTHTDIRADGWRLVGSDWARVQGPSGRAGRLASTAQAVGATVFVFGGYTVAPDGGEVSTPEVDAYDAASGRWSKAAAMPVPVDDAVSGVWEGQVVLVSGWHDRDNVRDVQALDVAADRWSSLPPIVGTPVFGHAGGVVGDTLLYCDGVGVDRSREPVFQAVQECHALDLAAPSLRWQSVAHHGRVTRYRAAATGWPARGWIVFAGGTARPYNYNGTGYDGIVAEPSSDVFAWAPASASWIALPPLPVPSMDHRGLVVSGDALWLVGGMTKGATEAGGIEVSAATWRLGPA